MVTIEELSDFLEENSTDLSWSRNEQEESLYIHSDQWNETIKVDLNKLNNLTIDLIKFKLQGGKNVAKITRVTGFFSNIAQWNPGKRGELRDRYRVNNGFNPSAAIQQTQQDRREIIETYASAGLAAHCELKKKLGDFHQVKNDDEKSRSKRAEHSDEA